MYTPQVTKKPTIPTNNVKFAKPLSNSHHGTWNSQNLQRIVQNPPNPPTLVQNFTKFMQFTLISRGSLCPTGKIIKIHAIHVNLKFLQILHNSHLLGNNPGYRKFSKIHPASINSQSLFHFKLL